jgi:alcohol dehydrogenase class IV
MSMDNFDVFIKTKIKFGINLHLEIGNIVKNLKFSNILICTDNNVKDLSFFNQIIDAFRAAKIDYDIFYDIGINPTLKTIADAKERYNEKKYDSIIAVGGGGPIDVAKALSIAFTHEGDINDYIAETSGAKKEIKENVLPVITMPSTAGSGAEVSPVSVLVDEKRKLKIGFFSEYLFPKIAVIDPVLYATLPPKATAECGLDVLAHAFDSYVSPYSNIYSEALSMKAVQLVFKNMQQCIYQGSDLDARGNMALASVIALIAMYIGKGGATHTIGEPLGGLYNIPHGYACGIAIPAMMEYLMPVCEDAFVQIYKNITEYADPRNKKRDMAAACLKEFEQLITDSGLKNLSSYILKPNIDLLSKYSIEHLAVDRIPRAVKEDDYKLLYEKIFGPDYLGSFIFRQEM